MYLYVFLNWHMKCVAGVGYSFDFAEFIWFCRHIGDVGFSHIPTVRSTYATTNPVMSSKPYVSTNPLCSSSVTEEEEIICKRRKEDSSRLSSELACSYQELVVALADFLAQKSYHRHSWQQYSFGDERGRTSYCLSPRSWSHPPVRS